MHNLKISDIVKRWLNSEDLSQASLTIDVDYLKIQDQISETSNKWNIAALALMMESRKPPSQRRMDSCVINDELQSETNRRTYQINTELWNKRALNRHKASSPQKN